MHLAPSDHAREPFLDGSRLNVDLGGSGFAAHVSQEQQRATAKAATRAPTKVIVSRPRCPPPLDPVPRAEARVSDLVRVEIWFPESHIAVVQRSARQMPKCKPSASLLVCCSFGSSIPAAPTLRQLDQEGDIYMGVFDWVLQGVFLAAAEKKKHSWSCPVRHAPYLVSSPTSAAMGWLDVHPALILSSSRPLAASGKDAPSNGDIKDD